jgi:hypothetical protein
LNNVPLTTYQAYDQHPLDQPIDPYTERTQGS